LKKQDKKNRNYEIRNEPLKQSSVFELEAEVQERLNTLKLDKVPPKPAKLLALGIKSEKYLAGDEAGLYSQPGSVPLDNAGFVLPRPSSIHYDYIL